MFLSVLIIAGASVSTGALGVEGGVESRGVPCPPCSIELETVVTLGSLDGPGVEALTPRSSVAIDAKGRILVSGATGIGRFAVFDADGAFLRYVGRDGEGPGEYGMIFALAADPDGWVHVFDPLRRRRTVLDTTFEVIRTDLVHGTVVQATALGSGVVAFFPASPSSMSSLRSIQVLDLDGSSRAVVPMSTEPPGNHAFGTDGALAWTIPEMDYRVSEWDLRTGERRGVVLPRANWFSDWDDDAYPRSLVVAVRPTDRGVMVAGATVDRRIEERVLPPRFPPRRSLTEELDGVLELIDPNTGDSLGHTIVDGIVTFVSNSHFVAVYRETDVGVPYLDLARIRLVPLQGGS